jgi:hypothetical protein
MRTPGWWWRSMTFAFVVLLLDAFLLRSILIESVPWPALMPPATRSVVFLFSLVGFGALAHAGGWTLVYLWRIRGSDARN